MMESRIMNMQTTILLHEGAVMQAETERRCLNDKIKSTTIGYDDLENKNKQLQVVLIIIKCEQYLYLIC